MIRVFVLYEQEPDPERYAEHVALCRAVPSSVFRHGKVTQTIAGDPLAYYAEYEFPDMDTYLEVAKSGAFGPPSEDAAAMGYPSTVHVADVG
jgi:hypothetical protein